MNSTDRDLTINDDVTMRDAAPAGGARRFRAGDEILGRYVVESELGQGGMGIVYLCLDKVGGVKVAVKGLPPEVSHSAYEMDCVRDNYQLVSELRHANIAGYRTLEQDANGDYYLVMDYARGTGLNRWMRQHGKTAGTEEKVAILRQIADALDYAHSHKPTRIIHRDIKPGNILVDGDRHVMLLDFGLAAQIRSSFGHVSQEVLSQSGTRNYKAPEQWRGQPQRAATDQYALGVVAYEMLSGGLPFDDDDETVLRQAVLNEPVADIEGLPGFVNAALRRAMAKQGENRFETCGAFIDALEGRKVVGVGASAGRMGIAVALLVVLALLVGGGWWWRECVRDEELRAKNEALAAERARQEEAKRLAEEAQIAAEDAKRKAEAERIAAEKAAAERQRVTDEEAAEKLRLAKIAERKAKDEEENARKAKEEAERREAEKARKSEEDAAAVVKREMMRREAEAAKLAEEQRRKADELRKAADARKAEELKKSAAASTAAAKADMERQRQMARLRERGSEFVPNPPVVAAGTERSVALPNGGRMDFVWCPPGRFLMGSSETEDKRNVDETLHLVTLTKGFWIGKTEVTRAQWKAVMGDAGFAFSSLWGGDGEFPIDTVNWQQCREFCDKAGNGFRLPTEAEWEYACRAGTATPFSFGASLNGAKANCSGGAEPYGTLVSGPNSFGSKRVASYQRNPWGIYDMHGNLFEWCADYYAEYPDGDLADPKGPERGDVRVVRGGCWNYAPKMCRSAFRSRKDPVSADTHTGFRVCCDRLP